MTPARLLECLAILRWSQRSLAEAVGYDHKQIQRWAAGATIPAPIAAWLDRLARYHAAHPPPQ